MEAISNAEMWQIVCPPQLPESRRDIQTGSMKQSCVERDKRFVVCSASFHVLSARWGSLFSGSTSSQSLVLLSGARPLGDSTVSFTQSKLHLCLWRVCLCWSVFVKLTQSFGKREPQLRNSLHQIGNRQIWNIFLMSDLWNVSSQCELCHIWKASR